MHSQLEKDPHFLCGNPMCLGTDSENAAVMSGSQWHGSFNEDCAQWLYDQTMYDLHHRSNRHWSNIWNKVSYKLNQLQHNASMEFIWKAANHQWSVTKWCITWSPCISESALTEKYFFYFKSFILLYFIFKKLQKRITLLK